MCSASVSTPEAPHRLAPAVDAGTSDSGLWDLPRKADCLCLCSVSTKPPEYTSSVRPALSLPDPAPCRNEKESESLTASDKEKESQPVGVDSGFLPSNCMVSNGPQFNGRSDTESADGGPLNGPKKKSSFKLPPFFKKKDKVSADPESLTHEAQLQDDEVPSPDKKNVNNQVTKSATPNPDGIVYAELDLQAGRRAVVVRPEDDKTEYAEIMHNAKQDEENDHAPQ